MSYDPTEDHKLLDEALSLLTLPRAQHVALIMALGRLRENVQPPAPAAVKSPQIRKRSPKVQAAPAQAPVVEAPAPAVQVIEAEESPKRRGRPKGSKNGIRATAQA